MQAKTSSPGAGSRLEGNIDLITGGTQGIGAAVATRFAEKGTPVFTGTRSVSHRYTNAALFFVYQS